MSPLIKAARRGPGSPHKPIVARLAPRRTSSCLPQLAPIGDPVVMPLRQATAATASRVIVVATGNTTAQHLTDEANILQISILSHCVVPQGAVASREVTLPIVSTECTALPLGQLQGLQCNRVSRFNCAFEDEKLSHRRGTEYFLMISTSLITTIVFVSLSTLITF